MTTNELSDKAKQLSDLANSNLALLEGKCQTKNEVQDYYLGILRKQAILLSDLSLLLKDRPSAYISTPFIILRSLLDDFMHMLFIESQSNKESEIIKINADTYKHSFSALKILMESNKEHFEEKYPFYLTEKEFKLLKKDFIEKEKNAKYFKDKSSFKFQEFMTFSKMTVSISITKEVNIFKARVYYLWKEFSSFVHFSNYSFEYEIMDAKENLEMINESFQYVYNTIYLSFKYFERELKLKFIDNPALNKEYGIIHKC